MIMMILLIFRQCNLGFMFLLRMVLSFVTPETILIVLTFAMVLSSKCKYMFSVIVWYYWGEAGSKENFHGIIHKFDNI